MRLWCGNSDSLVKKTRHLKSLVRNSCWAFSARVGHMRAEITITVSPADRCRLLAVVIWHKVVLEQSLVRQMSCFDFVSDFYRKRIYLGMVAFATKGN